MPTVTCDLNKMPVADEKMPNRLGLVFIIEDDENFQGVPRDFMPTVTKD